MKIIVRYGPDRHELESINPPTVGSLKKNDTLRAIFAWGDNLRALIDGVEQPDALLVPEGTTVTMETACNTKAN